MIHERHRKWIEARGLDPILAEKLGLKTVQDGQAGWLAVPYTEHGATINHKYRLTSEKRHRMDGGAPLTWWNHDCLLDDRVQNGEQPVIVTEGEWDAIAAIQSGFPHTISVPNGGTAKPTEGDINPADDAAAFSFLWRCRKLTDGVGKFILALDADDTGRTLAAELARRLDPARCLFVRYSDDCKDLNDVLQKGGPDEVRAVIAAAKPYPIKGLYRFSDFPEPPPMQRVSFGIPGLSELIGIVPGTLTVLTGYPGHGKSSLSMAILANLMHYGMPVAVGSFETMPKPIMHRRLMACLLGCAEHDLPKPFSPTYRKAAETLETRCAIIAQQVGEDQEMDLDEVLNLAADAVKRDGAKVLFIDPWNEVEHKRARDETETEYTNRAIRAVKQFARQYGIAVWIVAHPAKPDPTRKLTAPGLQSISGSMAWANKADYGIVCHRPDRKTNTVEVKVVKVRMGYPGGYGDLTLAYDFRTSTYSNVFTGEVE